MYLAAGVAASNCVAGSSGGGEGCESGDARCAWLGLAGVAAVWSGAVSDGGRFSLSSSDILDSCLTRACAAGCFCTAAAAALASDSDCSICDSAVVRAVPHPTRP